MTALAAAQPQEAVGQDATLQEDVELVIDEPGQFGAGAGFSVRDEIGRVLLHQAIQRGLLGAVALVVDRGTVQRHPGLPASVLMQDLTPVFQPGRTGIHRHSSGPLPSAHGVLRFLGRKCDLESQWLLAEDRLRWKTKNRV